MPRWTWILGALLLPITASAQDPQARRQEAGQEQQVGVWSKQELNQFCSTVQTEQDDLATKIDRMNQRVDQLLEKAQQASDKDKPEAILGALQEITEQQREIWNLHQENSRTYARHLAAQLADQKVEQVAQTCPVLEKGYGQKAMERPRG